jgi:sterol desaturase/sphingolipid hydroxylase (fatty acid hydroxylase superfamily)
MDQRGGRDVEMIGHLEMVLHSLLGLYLFVRLGIFYVSVMLVLVLIARQFEKKWPIDPDLPRSEVVSDWKATGVNLVLAWAAAPLTAYCTTAIVHAAGGGLIQLRSDGWWYPVSLVGLILVSDLYRYTSHRIYHAVPFLWALHSFHHSAEALTFVTGARHHWMDRVLEGSCFPILAILFKAPAELVTVAAFIVFLPDGCAHLNVRLPLGRAITWFNSPQWHRIHHSTQPEHFNKNFAAFLPLWDIVFGTAWIPGKDEYPSTGLVPAEKCDVLTSIVWPFRHYVRRMRLRLPTWPAIENSTTIRKLFAKVGGTPVL